EAALQEVIAELEQDKAAQETGDSTKAAAEAEAAAAQQVIAEKSEDIQEKVSDGASVQEAIAETTQEELKEKQAEITEIYGHSVLGPGDKVRISIFGPSQADFEFVISQDDSISPQGMPKIFLKGIPLERARTLLENRFRNRYTFSPEQFSVVLTTARTITVNI